MTGDGGEYLRPEDLKELGDDSLPSSQFLDGMNYLRYSLEGGRSDRYTGPRGWQLAPLLIIKSRLGAGSHEDLPPGHERVLCPLTTHGRGAEASGEEIT